MTNIDNCRDKIYVKTSSIPDAGRGVYAGRDIKKGELIERCPIIPIPAHDMSNLTETVLVTYFFYYGKNKELSAIAMGYGSIYNHSYTPNCTFEIRPEAEVIEFTALTDIKKDEEITFDYTHRKPGSTKKTPLWFEV